MTVSDNVTIVNDSLPVDVIDSDDTVNGTNDIDTNTIKTSVVNHGVVNTDLTTGNPLVILLACLLMILIPFRKRTY